MHERNRRSFCSAFLMVLATSLVVALWLYHRGLIPQPFDVPGSLLTNNAANTHFQARAAEGALLEVFQVYPPVLTVAEGDLLLTDGSSNASSVVVDSDPRYCQQTLVSYVFGNSYGSPFVAEYTAPACEFNRITWNLTVVSAGRQFDRLAIVYLGDLEVFRTSTAEPTASGIQWTYLKRDMTPFLSTMRQDQKLIFDLGNLVNDVYTASFNVTLTAVYFNAVDSIDPADQIISISAHRSATGQSSAFTLPGDNASNNISLPRNIRRAIFTLSATGQIDEEFWWSNVPSSDVDTFPDAGTLLGYSPFREVQLFIDGILAGVAWPFDIIFTGGVVPYWRPIVGIDAFDLKEDEIDISPWLGRLCDGKSHEFTIRVAGLSDGENGVELTEEVGSYWVVTGKLFLWLDDENSVTTAESMVMNVPQPQLRLSSSISQASNGSNSSLTYEVAAARKLFISAMITTSRGTELTFWQQTRNFTNSGNITQGGFAQTNVQSTNSVDLSSSGYARRADYPLYAESVYTTEADNFSIQAIVNREKNVQTLGMPVFPTGLESFTASSDLQIEPQGFQGASLRTSQNLSATYMANTTSGKSFSFGIVEQMLKFSGILIDRIVIEDVFPSIIGGRELFMRDVTAVNGSIVDDRETLLNRSVIVPHHYPGSDLTADLVLSGHIGIQAGTGHRAQQ